MGLGQDFSRNHIRRPQLAFRKGNGINSRRAGALSSLYRILCEFQKDFPSWEKLSISSHHTSDKPNRLEWSFATAQSFPLGKGKRQGGGRKEVPPFLAEAARWQGEGALGVALDSAHSA